jgi:hypothetical protein
MVLCLMSWKLRRTAVDICKKPSALSSSLTGSLSGREFGRGTEDGTIL